MNELDQCTVRNRAHGLTWHTGLEPGLSYSKVHRSTQHANGSFRMNATNIPEIGCCYQLYFE